MPLLTSPCPAFTFTSKLLVVKGLISASQLRSHPHNRLELWFPPSRCRWTDPWLSRPCGRERPLDGGATQCTPACTRVSVETVWNLPLPVSVSTTPFIVWKSGWGTRPAGQMSKGLFILVFQCCILVKWQTGGHGGRERNRVFVHSSFSSTIALVPSVSCVHIEAATQRLDTRREWRGSGKAKLMIKINHPQANCQMISNELLGFDFSCQVCWVSEKIKKKTKKKQIFLSYQHFFS